MEFKCRVCGCERFEILNSSEDEFVLICCEDCRINYSVKAQIISSGALMKK